MRGASVLALLALAAAPLAAQPDPGEVAHNIRFLVERMAEVDDAREAASWRAGPLLSAFYERRGFEPAWTDARNVADMIAGIRGAFDAGLDPGEYHLEGILAYREQPSDPVAAARLDLLLSDALFALAFHYRFGKVDPASVNPNWNIERTLGAGVDPIEVVENTLARRDLTMLLASLQPQHEFYVRLKRALADYRALEAAGGWPPIAAGETLRVGMEDPRVVTVRQRLKRTADLAESAGDGPLFDETLEQAVKVFQYRHGLGSDGVIGKGTLAALNVPVAQRIDEIRVNLERARWVLHQADPDAVYVNVAGAMAYVTRGGKVAWMTRVMVGKPYRKTPLFRDDISYLVLNPTWTAPYSIATKDILPAVQKNPAYLAERNITVLDRSGKPVNPASIDWSSLSRSNFPYTLRQEPGPNNALGRIKFMFPNEHAVYLHDTPSRSLFERDVRTFSSGCIRVEKPLELAEILINDPEHWSLGKLEAAVASGETRTVRINPPEAVYLTYWTAAVDDDGELNFSRDVYDRDPAVLEALEAPFVPAEDARRQLRERLSSGS
jgi:murein L,D-transpeptidase YcbB/YkuD